MERSALSDRGRTKYLLPVSANNISKEIGLD